MYLSIHVQDILCEISNGAFEIPQKGSDLYIGKYYLFL